MTDNEVSENDFAPQHVENPLEYFPNQSVQSLQARTYQGSNEAPPPYSEFMEGTGATTQRVEVIELSSDNSPQVLMTPQHDYFNYSAVTTPSTLLGSPAAQIFPAVPGVSTNNDIRQMSTRDHRCQPTSTQAKTPLGTVHSHAKAREAGFQIDQSPSLDRSSPGSVLPEIITVSSVSTFKHVCEPGRVVAFLVPFPKPMLKGIKPENIPDRFLIYTPPLPPLSKPEPGQTESSWHKTQRLWQEDVRRATMTNASMATWKGMKARTTAMVNKGVGMTRSSTVEFLDRVSEGMISSTASDAGAVQTPAMQPQHDHDMTAAHELAASYPSGVPGQHAGIPSTLESRSVEPNQPPSVLSSSSSSVSTVREPDKLEFLTLIHPPSLSLTPQEIRKEFVDSLVRTREQSRNKALVASALLPLAATMDAVLVVTLGGLTQASGVVAYQNTRGAVASKKLSKALLSPTRSGVVQASMELETKRCECEHHDDDSVCSESVSKASNEKGKSTKKGNVNGMEMHVEASSALDAFTRYLELACLQKSFAMFPHVRPYEPRDPKEQDVLDSIGWTPKRRSGRDLDIEANGEGGGKLARLSAEQDEEWQRREALADVANIARKAASEWVAACKGFKD